MYYNSEDLKDFHGYRIEQLAEFVTSGWGCIRIKDLCALFRLKQAEFAHARRHMKSINLTVIEVNDYLYFEVYPGYKPEDRFMDTISAFTSIAKKHPTKNIMITTALHTNFFTAKMHMKDPVTKELRTYYAIDTQLTSFPLYVLEDVLKEELHNNGFSKKNRLILIVPSEKEVEHIDIENPLFFALKKIVKGECVFEFYNNNKLVNEKR